MKLNYGMILELRPKQSHLLLTIANDVCEFSLKVKNHMNDQRM